MELKQIKKEVEPNIGFYDGISLSEYDELAKRWEDMLYTVHEEIKKYVNDEELCFGDKVNLFPIRSRLTGNYYIDHVSYIKHVNLIGFQIIVSTRLTEYVQNGEDDYLGLEVTLFTKSKDDIIEVWGVDSSSI